MLTGTGGFCGEDAPPPLTMTERRPPASESLGENLIFLISQPRAGSTLLQMVLGANPEVHTLSEPWIALNPIFALRPSGWAADFDASLARGAIEEFLRHLPDGEEAYWCAVRRMLSDLYGRALSGTGKQIFLDKTPRYYFVIPELRRIFPRARFIFLLRNPLAVLSSILNTWVKSENPMALRPARHDLMAAPRLLLDSMRQPAPNTFVVRYEDLVSDPHREIPRLCEFLGISFHPGMIEYGSATGHPRWLYGDQGTVYNENRPIAQLAIRWSTVLKSSATWASWARSYLDALGPDLVTGLGYDYSQLSIDFPGPTASIDWEIATETDDEAEARLHSKLQQADATIRAQHERSASLELAADERLADLNLKQRELAEIAAEAERRRRELELATQAVAERDLRIANLERRVAERLLGQRNGDREIQSREERIEALQTTAAQRLDAMLDRDREIQMREGRIEALETTASQRLEAMLDRDREIQIREGRIAVLETAAAERLADVEDKERTIHLLTSELSRITPLADSAGKWFAAMCEKEEAISGLLVRLADLESALVHRDARASALEQAAAERLSEMHEKDRCISSLLAELEKLRQRPTFPFLPLKKG